MRELEQFLADNVKDCSFKEVGFGKAAMHTHVFAHTTKRRRNIKDKGYDYSEVSTSELSELFYCLNLCDY